VTKKKGDEKREAGWEAEGTLQRGFVEVNISSFWAPLFFSLKFFWVFCMVVVVVVVAIHLGGGSWGLISSQPVVFLKKIYNYKFFYNFKKSSVNYYNKLTKKIGIFLIK
jgi:hypothetical protein